MNIDKKKKKNWNRHTYKTYLLLQGGPIITNEQVAILRNTLNTIVSTSKMLSKGHDAA